MHLELENFITFQGHRILGTDNLLQTDSLSVATTTQQVATTAREQNTMQATSGKNNDAQQAARQRLAAKMPTRDQWRKIVKKSRESGAAERQQQLEDNEMSS